jgi:alanine racemase
MNRVQAEIDLSAIRHNLQLISSLVGLRVNVMPVVKANAYGHGAAEVARVAHAAGAEWLAVATVEEGVALRKLLPNASLCLLSPFSHDLAEEIVVNRLTPVVGDLETARALSRTAQRLRTGIKIHIELDTGMGRSGFLTDQAAKQCEIISRMPSIVINGMSTHFPSAEDDPEFTHAQIVAFMQVKKQVEATDTQLLYLHCANSAALLRYPESRMNMVRPGLLTYGIHPDIPSEFRIPDLRPALTLKSFIVQVRTLPAGHTISYGRTHTLSQPRRIATVPVGYGDGYPREMGNAGCALVSGRRVPVVGRVCMDMLTLDVTEIEDAAVGTEVVLIGAQGQERITVEKIARAAKTTEHEITTRLTARVPRLYHNVSPRV